ncbi:hypothetical protein GCM10009676_20690 [Prauserella halophila]|uniref:STAS domain-containing protein n=1 Tax=Prauserella halophila TaxID=185641 RepID=A0ABP4GXJ1_9PSEU|nr:DUF6292 family protein [Prauserella halophila]MCP2235737.1 anti-anti-sigma factor [Prauserella halophila]
MRHEIVAGSGYRSPHREPGSRHVGHRNTEQRNTEQRTPEQCTPEQRSTEARSERQDAGYGSEGPVGQHVRVRRVRHGHGVEICEIGGELDLLTVPIVHRELDGAAEQARHRLVVDMSAVEFCSVAGVELLLRAARRATGRGGRIAVVAGRQVRRVVRLVVPDGPILWFDSAADAVHHVGGDWSAASSGLAGMDLDSTQRGLRRYVEVVAAGLGLEAAAAWSDVDDLTATAYIALDGELPGMEGREVALVWDGRTGWALGAETHSGEDLVIRAWYGTELLPDPDAVVRFVKELTVGRRVGLDVPPEPSGQPHAAQIVRARLQAAAWSDQEPHPPEVDVPAQGSGPPRWHEGVG